uniref:Uncharacterized protein n=1 Tax=viral metagenome TaxID=1070528 RepID=A0A6M3L0L9_9ZZZZ
MANTVTVSGTTVTVTSANTQGPQGPPGDFAEESGTKTLNGSTGVAVVFSTARTDTDYVVLYEQQSLSGEAQFLGRSKGEISTESKTINGFTVKSSPEMSGVIVRWVTISYTA